MASRRSAPSVSVYMPTQRQTAEVDHDRIRLKNHLREAAEHLEETGIREPTIRDLLAPAHDLLDDAEFWRHQQDGLAILLSDGFQRVELLPVEVEDLVVVSDRFHVTPLIGALGRERMLLLALSRGSVRLFEITRSGAVPIEIDAPASVEDANWFADREKALQHHSTRRGGADVFHGHDPDEDEQEDVRRFLTAVAGAVEEVARERESAVLLAAVEEFAGQYRKLAGHDMADPVIPGSPDDRSAADLHAEALSIMEAALAAQARDAALRLGDAIGEDRAVVGVEATLKAGSDGRVEEVMVARARHVWGRWDETSFRAEVHVERRPGDEELLDRAVVATLERGGRAWLLDDLPVDEPVAAVVRF